MIDLTTLDTCTTMFVATASAGVAGYVLGCVRQFARDAKAMDTLRARLKEKQKKAPRAGMKTDDKNEKEVTA